LKRHLLNLLTALSLLLCVAVVALWVRSYWVTVWRECRWFSPQPDRRSTELYAAVGRGSMLVGLNFLGNSWGPSRCFPTSGVEWTRDSDEHHRTGVVNTFNLTAEGQANPNTAHTS
jgi:hypothetical protein